MMVELSSLDDTLKKTGRKKERKEEMIEYGWTKYDDKTMLRKGQPFTPAF